MEQFLAIEPEAGHRIADERVVHRLPDHEVARWMQSRRGDGVHRRVRDVLYGHRDVVIPCQDLLVVAGAHETPILVTKRDGIDSR